MKRIIKRLTSLFVSALIVTCLGCVVAFAEGSCDLQISPKNAGVGERINVTIEFSTVNMDVDSAECVVKYDPAVMEIDEDSPTQGSGGSIKISKMAGDAPVVKIDMIFVAKKQGSTSLSVEETTIYNFAGEAIGSPTANSSVKIGENSGLDSDSKMKALEISEGKLSPAFSPDVTSYTVDVDNDVLNIEISGQMRSTKSIINFSGGFSDIEGVDGTSPKVYKGRVNLNEGDNVRKITITAENGEETVYTINIVRHKSGDIIPIDPDEKPVVTTPSAEEPEENINIFQTNASTPKVTTVNNKSPKDDNIFEKLLPVFLIVTFVFAGVLIIIVAFAVIQARREKQKKTRRRTQRTQQSSGSRPRSSQSQRPRQQSKSSGSTSVKKKKSGNSNIRRPK